MEFKDIVKKLRKEYGLSQDELSKRIGVARSSVANYENGQNFPSTDILLKLSKVFYCSVDYLLGKTNERNSNVQIDNSDKLFLVPIIGKITAGEPILADENIEDYFPVSASMYNLTTSDGLFFLKVVGDSMNNVIEDGSYALIKKQDTAENGDIIVALVNGDNEATMKRFEQINNALVALKPDSTNKDYSVRYIDLATTEFKIIGKIIGKFKSMN